MNLLDYQYESLKYLIGYFRQNKDITDFLKVLTLRGNIARDVILKLLHSYKIQQARGKFLDYIGAEVGAKRDEVDYGNYFCVNQPHINVNKLFYFLTSGEDPRYPIILEDAEFIQKIQAYIGANVSSGTLEETVSIIKTITNADNVEITKGELGVKVYITGQRAVLTANTINYIKRVLGDGIYLEEVNTNE